LGGPRPRSEPRRRLAEAPRTPTADEPIFSVAPARPLKPTARPMAQKSQPMVLRGCREATMAPTTEKVRTMAKERTTVSASPTLPYGSPGGVDPIVRASATPPPRSATESTTSDQASQAAERVLVPPTPRPCSFALSVTTPLYSTTVSQALRLTLRGKGLNDIDPHHQPRAHGGPGDVEVGTQVLSLVSVLMMSTSLSPS
jgi:hypothetical protein